jgi:F-type H+-transporting ATPase subunit beta
MASGKITQIIGAVIDVEFPRESIPSIYEALKLKDVDLTLEVQQQLGDGVVRTIAMGASEGLKRGIAVESTGKPINVPVGQATLGRIMDVLGVRRTTAARSPRRKRCRFTVPRRRTTNRPAVRICSSRASRSSTCSCRSPRAARSACSAAPASARP